MAALRSPAVGFAHRGARDRTRENTLDAFAVALSLGATGLESDVWRTSDGEVVLDHDGIVRSGLRRRKISEVRRVALPSHMPTLAELYDACGTGFDLSLDVKDPAAAAGVVATARSAGGDALGRLWLCSPSWECAATWRSLDDTIRLVDSTRLAKIKEGPERRAARLAETGIDALNMHHTDWTAGLVALCHRFERFALGWDAQFDRILVSLLAMGIDGVFSDHPDLMMAAIDAHQR